MRLMSPLASWIVVAVALIVAETLVVYLLRWVAPEISVEAVYLVVSSVWGLALGVVTVVIAAAIGFSYVPPFVASVASDSQGAAALKMPSRRGSVRSQRWLVRSRSGARKGACGSEWWRRLAPLCVASDREGRASTVER
jgi:hypothetical protein